MTPLSHFVQRPDLPEPVGEAICCECAARGASCCMTDPALTHLSFPISPAEWRRIAPYAALATTAPFADSGHFTAEDAAAMKAAQELFSPVDAPALLPAKGGKCPSGGDEVCAAEANTPDFIASMRALFPEKKSHILGLFPEDGTHLTMRTRSDGSCVFLGNAGCRLHRAVRPWYCLLFPAWVAGGCLTLFLSEDCLISQRARGPAHGISLLGTNAETVRKMHARLCADWGL